MYPGYSEIQAKDSQPFESFEELKEAVLTHIVSGYPPPDPKSWPQHLAWVLFVLPYSYLVFVSPVSDWLDRMGQWSSVLILLGAAILGYLWVSILDPLLNAFIIGRIGPRIKACAAAIRVDLTSAVEVERQHFAQDRESWQRAAVPTGYSRRIHTANVAQAMVEFMCRQAGKGRPPAARDFSTPLKSKVPKLVVILSRVVAFALCIWADAANSLWPWLAAAAILLIVLLCQWDLDPDQEALKLALVAEARRSLSSRQA